MRVRELIKKLERCPQDYVVEYHVGTDHAVVDICERDKVHKRTDWWKRRRKVVILK